VTRRRIALGCATAFLLVGVLLAGAPREADGAGEDALIQTLLDAARDAAALAGVKIDYPADRSIFPPEIVAPTFLWHDASSGADRWLVDIAFDPGTPHLRALVSGAPPPQGEIDPKALGEANEIYKPTPYQASAKSWEPSEDFWSTFKARSVDRPALVTLYGYRAGAPGKILSKGSTTLSTSSDPVGAPVFYRDVPLMPTKGKDGVIKPLSEGAVPLIAWRLKDISRTDSRVLLRDMPTCANCHSFSADGKTFGMDVDGPDGDKGAYGFVPLESKTMIQAGQVISWNRFPGKPKGHMTLGFLSRVSPDGQFVVSTVNEALYVQNFTDYKFSQVFYPTRGILAYYSRATGKIEALPGADDPRYVHCSPVFTPDGGTIVFARAAATDPYSKDRPRAAYAGDPNETPIQYDLYRIPFRGGSGGTPEPIRGASGNGMSNTFPKVSPDGKWIVFTQCANGQLMRPDGKLMIVPLAGGEARPMRCNLPLMNSWHSFSPNGRWLVFSSKSNTPYTQMFLTHIDAEGRDSPAILVENATAANRAVNIPEFVNVPYDRFQSISVPAVDHWRHLKKGAALARDGKDREAIQEFERALEGEYYDWRSNDWKTHANMSTSLMKLGDVEGAVEHVRRSLELNPMNAEMHTNLGYLLAEQGHAAEALEQLNEAVRLSPKDALIRCNRGKLRMSLGDPTGGLEDFEAAIRLDPSRAEAWSGRAAVRMNQNDLVAARKDLDRAIELDSSQPASWYFRALVRQASGDLAGALADLDQARRIVTPGSAQQREIETLREQIRQAREAGR